MTSVPVTRKLLYDQVWSDPMCHVSKRYGISDVGLAKICRKHNIPCPPRGYWAKKGAGQSPKQLPLPDPGDNSRIEIRELCDSPDEPVLSQELQRQFADENGKPFQFDLRDHLRGSHSLISEANQQLQTSRQDENGLIILPEKFPLDLRVSKSMLRRSLFVMDALLRAFESHGDTVSSGPCVVLLNVPVRFGISEALEAHREEVESADLTGRYEFNHNRFRSKRVPSGRLTFQIRDHKEFWVGKCRQAWRDSPKQPLEQRLESIIAGVLAFAARVRQREVELRSEEEARAAAALRRQEEAKQRAIRQAAIKAEHKRFGDLMAESVRWQQSKTLREYILAAKQTHIDTNGSIEPGSEMEKWLDWASQQADWLDPLTDSPPSLLNEKVEEEVNHFTGIRNRW